ncbi:TonB-dependent receptor [Parapedobacter tibetensis]|uniref:TonB-dependent receptor n=1 Tax=Parapedobacter tibetensis TaxID=2972951 RepID=UPI00214D1D65|nr:TonB-dependent receptor [Parapedobacter tibetensis]
MTTFNQSGLKQTTKACLLVALFLSLGLSGFSQIKKRVQGTLNNQSGEAIVGASIKLISDLDSVQTSSGRGGLFSFNNIKGERFVLTVTSLGFDTFRQNYAFESGKSELMMSISLNESSQMLAEVSITGVAAITVKEDTLEYRTKDLRLREGALVEDALKKLDGVEVDKDGNVTAQGETVTRVRINGKDFFGGDVKTATKNLPAEIIEKIQIVDDYGDMANITGNRTGDPERILNIEIAPSRNNGDFGNYRVGGGTEERYQLTGMYSMFKDGLQLSALGNLNNTNASLFDFNIRGGGARRGRGGGGSFGRGFGGGWGGSNGLTNTGSIGFNYRQDVNDKLTMYGNYSYGHNDNTTLSNTYDFQDFRDTVLIKNGNTNNGSIGNDHRFDYNIEYKPNDKDYIKISPTFSLRSGNSNNVIFRDNILNENLINEETNLNSDKSYSPNFGGSGLYNRRLNDRGRNVFVNFSLNSSSTDQDQENIRDALLYATAEEAEEIYQRSIVDLRNKNLNGGASLSYIEPLGKNSNLEVNYDYNFATYDNSRTNNAYDADGGLINDPSLTFSRDLDYTFSTHRAGLTYRYRTDKLNYSIGASAQPNLLRGEANVDGVIIPISRNGFNFVPVARVEYKFSRSKSLNLNYSGRANEPSFSQLQPFTDATNQAAPVTGNPNLNAEFSHEVRLNYRNFNVSGGNSIFASLSGTMTEDRIVTNRTQYVDSIGVVQATEYLNADGFYNVRGFFNFSKPFSDRKYVVSLSGFSSYNNNVSYTSSIENIARNLVLSPGLNLQYNPKETIEITPGVRYTYNTTTNTVSSRTNSDVSTWALTLNSIINITPTWVWGGDFAKTSNTGYTSGVDANPVIINTYIEKQFFKGRNGAIRFQAYDLLNEQINVSRNVTENGYLDSRSNRLARYFMLTLSYRFSNFAGGSMGMDGPGGPGGYRRGG